MATGTVNVSWLRAARERSGVTLEQLAATTKIGRRYLDALEAGDVEKLPPPFYARGFVRAYASAVGLDPQQATERYCEELGLVRPADGDDVAAIVETAVGRTGVTSYDAHHAPLIKSLHPEPNRRLVVAAAVVGAAMYVAPSSWNGWVSKVAASTPPPAATSASVEPAPAPAPAPARVDPAPAPIATNADGALKFEIKPQGDCWFSATPDGGASQSGLLKAGDQRAIDVNDAVVLRVGDPGACTFSINGHEAHPLGAAGIPVTVRITRDNYKEFLGS